VPNNPTIWHGAAGLHSVWYTRHAENLPVHGLAIGLRIRHPARRKTAVMYAKRNANGRLGFGMVVAERRKDGTANQQRPGKLTL